MAPGLPSISIFLFSGYIPVLYNFNCLPPTATCHQDLTIQQTRQDKTLTFAFFNLKCAFDVL